MALIRAIEHYYLYEFLYKHSAITKEQLDIENIYDCYNKMLDNNYIVLGKRRTTYKKKIAKLRKNNKYVYKIKEYKKRINNDAEYLKFKKQIKELSKELNSLIKSNNKVRVLNEYKVGKYNIIGVFDSALSRAMNIKIDSFTEDIICIKSKNNKMIEQLILNGFKYKDHKYKYFTSSAGQIRTKKTMWIKESTWERIEKNIMCGLTIDDINESEEQGCNTNKFMAYCALVQSATEEIGEFDIDRCIVVDDFITKIKGKVDYINKNTINKKNFKIEHNKSMDIEIEHSDGCGMVLPKISKRNFMIRLPWLKGLMASVDFIKWNQEYNNGICKVTDIWGKEWDLIEDNIQYIFSKSQFKMWKYYKNWQEYKNYFKLYICQANKCNEELDFGEFKNKKYNYQMWQTLTDMSRDEVRYFTKFAIKAIDEAYSTREGKLSVLGVNREEYKLTGLQKILRVYPEFLNDKYCKDKLSSAITKYKNDMRQGKIIINAKRTFILPDVFAWMEYLFCGIKKPKGILKNNQVFCKLYKNQKKLLVNRSPHLWREHPIRENIISMEHDREAKEKLRYFSTNAIYTSIHDLISKLLQFDVDGDEALAVADKKLIFIADRNMKDIRPLYYEMGKAKAERITRESLYKGLKNAWKYGNIGKFSNKLTKLWNHKNIDLDIARIICALNNWAIDSAKTLEMPRIHKSIRTKLSLVEKLGLPYFFKYVKNNEYVVEDINDSTVNMFCKEVDNIKFKNYIWDDCGNFSKYNLLSKNIRLIKMDDEIIEKYEELVEDMQKRFHKNKEVEKEELANSIYSELNLEFKEFCESCNIRYIDAVDMVIKYIYANNKNGRKAFMCEVLTDQILDNLNNNIKKDIVNCEYIICSECGKRIKKNSNRQKMCNKCAKELRKERDRIRKRKIK